MALKEWYRALDGYLEKIGQARPLPPPTDEESAALDKFTGPSKSIREAV